MTKKSPDLGLYVHIPFCRARCGYCDFVTFTDKEDRIDGYVQQLCREIRLYPKHRALSTIFFGGGTPSLLSPSQVSQILETARSHWGVDVAAEITLEANPESLTEVKARGWRSSGVNRLSIGLQAFDNDLLRQMDRLHSVEEFLAAYRSARQAGFENISIDLIYGLPGQSQESWQTTLERTVELAPEHLSLYALKVEEHTPFHVKGITVNDDRQAGMYEWARTYLKSCGFAQYEISNFSREARECRHNLIYWRQQDYYGVGTGAVGCVGGLRWENHKNLHDYGHAMEREQLPRLSAEALSPETRRFERLMLGLRLREGIEWEEQNPEWLSHRATLKARQWLEEIQPGRWRIPESMVALSNQVLLPFVP